MKYRRIFKNLTILAVDGNLDNLELVKVIFECCKAKVITVSSSIEAVEIINKKKPKVLLCEIAMSDEDGYWLIRQLRNSPRPIRKIPAIAVTGLASKDVLPMILESGFCARLVKPYDPDELIALVSKLVIKKMLSSCLRQYQTKKRIVLAQMPKNKR